MTVTHVANETLRGWRRELAAAGRSRGTIGVRMSHVRRFFDFAEKSPDEVTRADLIDWMAKQEWAPATRRSVRASLRGFFAWYAAEHGLDGSVASGLPIVAQPRAVPRPCLLYTSPSPRDS